MTPEEANAVNVVCSYLAGKDDPIPREVARALEILASRAHNRIQTGWGRGSRAQAVAGDAGGPDR